MSGDIVSKNLFDVLGNDPELDPDRAPEPPTKAIDKPVARSGKRNGPTEAPARDSGRAPRGGRSDGATGSELAFRDRNAGRDANRRRPAEDGERGNYRGRGRGRGGRGGGPRDDRHSKTGISEHDKQAAHGWGGQTGNEELADEKAGDAQVDVEKKDEAEAANEVEGGADAVEPEEDKTKSYAAWQAEQEAKRAALGQSLEVRKANEGASKKFPEGKAIAREESEDFIAGTGGKKKRDRERKEKTVVELDNPRMYDQPREQSGRGRGGRGGRGEFRGEGRGRGGGGGGRGRGEFRGGRGGRGGASGPNVTDEKAFPSLGA